MKKVEMDILTSVEYLENAINAGKSGFFMNTEFGVIAVESNLSNLEDDMHSVFVCTWQDAPRTQWAVDNSELQADYYVTIVAGKTNFATHMYTIEALITCMLYKCFGSYPTDDVRDAVVAEYLRVYENNRLTVNHIEKEFVKAHYTMFVRRNPIVQQVTRDWIIRRMNDAERVAYQIQMILRKCNNNIDWTDEFKSILWGATLYNNGVTVGMDRVPITLAIDINDVNAI